jgi:hypothetical protein
MPGFVIAHGNCRACGQLFSFNPDKVPRLRDYTGIVSSYDVWPQDGFELGPVCADCMARSNAMRRVSGLDPHPIARTPTRRHRPAVMGEARRKIDADACGIARPRDDRCPVCRSRRIVSIPPDRLDIECEMQACADCRTVWEPFPASYVRDPVCAEPCDNCAFRPGSPEQAAPERWKTMIESLKPDSEWWFTGHFYCHKGVPIDMTKGPGNFLFPQKPILMDGEPVRNADGTIVTVEDISKMRTCSGFLRMFWARLRKQEATNA